MAQERIEVSDEYWLVKGTCPSARSFRGTWERGEGNNFLETMGSAPLTMGSVPLTQGNREQMDRTWAGSMLVGREVDGLAYRQASDAQVLIS